MTPNKRAGREARLFYLARPEGLTHERLGVRSPLRGAYATLRRPISLCEIVELPTPEFVAPNWNANLLIYLLTRRSRPLQFARPISIQPHRDRQKFGRYSLAKNRPSKGQASLS